MSEQAHNQELLEMCKAHFNEPVLLGFELARCIGYGESAIDCYVIAKKRGGKIVWHTCVGGYTFLDRLRGQDYVRSNGGEDWDDLYRLCSSLTCGGAPKEDEFRLDLRHDDFENATPQGER